MKAAKFQFDDRKYKLSLGRPPKGYGSWAFEVEGHLFFAPTSTLTQAKAYAKHRAQELTAGAAGTFVIYIMP